MIGNLGLVALGHIVLPDLGILLLVDWILDTHTEKLGVDVCQLGTISVTTTNNPFSIVIIVCRSQQVTKGQLGVPELFLLMKFNPDTTKWSVVFNCDGTSLLINRNLDIFDILWVD